MKSSIDALESQPNNPGRRLVFLDVLKGLAIIAVICDHAQCWSTLCPLTFLPHATTIFSVSLFILCAGYTSAMSLERHKTSPAATSFSWIRKKVVHILTCYFIATAVYLFFSTPNHMIRFSQFVYGCISFKTAPPFYFIVIFLQLLIVAPFFYQLFSAKGGTPHLFLKILFYLLTILLAFGCMKFTRVDDLYGQNMFTGGKYLFGGPYLILYVTGQIIYIYKDFFLNKKNNLIFLVVSICLFIILLFKPFNGIKGIIYVNPPGFRLFFYTATIFFGVSLLFLWAPAFGAIVLSPVSFLGKYSLEIFLYHVLVMNLCAKYAGIFPNTSAWRIFLGAAAFICYLIIPILCTMLCRYLKKLLNTYLKASAQ